MKTTITIAAVAAITALATTAFADGKGEAVFKEKCAVCHPGGGNIVNAKKTLKKADLKANKLDNEKAIVKYLRNPGPGMTKFDAKVLPEKQAKEVAEYVLKAFK